MKKTLCLLVRGFCVALTACALMLTFVGCTGSVSTGSNSNTKSTQTKQVTDAYGRTVEVPASVQTCATVGSATRFVVYAGGIDKLIAATEIDTRPSIERPYTIAWAEVLSKLPTTSNGNHLMETSVDGEHMLKLAPQVIISSRSAEECNQLQSQLGIPVVGISYQNQLFSDDVLKSLSVVGEVLGTTTHVNQLVNQLKGWKDDLNNRTKDIASSARPSCYVGAVNYKGKKSFTGTCTNYAPFVAVNAVNVADVSGQKGSFDTTLEQIGTWNPDFMFLNGSNMDLLKKDYFANQAFFDGLKAFKDDNLYSQPAYNMNGTNIEIGVCDAYFVGATIYPESFAGVDLQATYANIFMNLLGKDCYAQMQAQGLDFVKLAAF